MTPSQAQTVTIGGRKISRKLIPVLLGGFLGIGTLAFMATYSGTKSPSELKAEREAKEAAEKLRQEPPGTKEDMKRFIESEEQDRLRREAAEKARREEEERNRARPPLPSGNANDLDTLRDVREYALSRNAKKPAGGQAELPLGQAAGVGAVNEKPFEAYPGMTQGGVQITPENQHQVQPASPEAAQAQAANNARVEEARRRQAANAAERQRTMNDLRQQQAAGAKGGQPVQSGSADGWVEPGGASQQALKPAEAIVADRFQPAYAITEGTIIPAVLLTHISSDLPGQVQARTTFDLYNSTLTNGRNLLIPKGSLIVGKYQSDVKPGQERVMFTFTRIVMGDGRSVQLPNMAAADAKGASGVEGEVDNHWLKQFGPAALTALIGFGVDYAFPQNSNDNSNSGTVIYSQGQNGGNVIRQVVPDIARRSMDRFNGIKPTIEIPAGTKFNIMVSRDISLVPGADRATVRK